MFEGNLLTFNPGWDQHKQELPHFQDVRELQAELDSKGIELAVRTDPEGQGTGYLQLADPDGNASTLVDGQHANQGWHLPRHRPPIAWVGVDLGRRAVCQPRLASTGAARSGRARCAEIQGGARTARCAGRQPQGPSLVVAPARDQVQAVRHAVGGQ
ncbi:hypothetical protein G6F32_015096 [Rhizopus arrhizus]|nr:hypothetical protein G6F32_015096 [Rhizopus arrhizus]